MKSSKTLVTIIILAVIIGAIIFGRGIFMNTEELENELQFNNEGAPATSLSSSELKAPKGTIKVEMADTEEKKEKGLSGRTELAVDSGMLFTFDEVGEYNFWMKDMNFPLDIIWIDEDKTVIGIDADISPDTYPESFTSPSPAKYVLELNAGGAEKYGISIGTELQF